MSVGTTFTHRRSARGDFYFGRGFVIVNTDQGSRIYIANPKRFRFTMPIADYDAFREALAAADMRRLEGPILDVLQHSRRTAPVMLQPSSYKGPISDVWQSPRTWRRVHADLLKAAAR